MKTILFQGDSITDCGRFSEDFFYVGQGYPLLIKAALGSEFPGEYQFVNRGTSGNRIVDLYARIKADIINIKPDVMSILIGVNDVWHEFSDNPNGVDAEKYFKIYSMLIEEVLAELPNLKIMIMEPFTLKGSGNEAYWDKFEAEVKLRAVKAREIAEKYNLTFIPLQDKFDEAAKKAENSYWLADGVHPTPIGAAIIQKEWLKGFNKIS